MIVLTEKIKYYMKRFLRNRSLLRLVIQEWIEIDKYLC